MERAFSKPLGSGLASLLCSDGPNNDKNVLDIPLHQLKPGAFQPRKNFDPMDLDALSKSIESKGVVQPIIVRLVKGDQETPYEIIAGERRWRASKMIGLSTIPCIVMELKDQEVLEIALVENVQRSDLSPIDEAEGYARLMTEFAYTQEKLSSVLGKSRSHLANTLRLNQLPESVKKKITNGDLTSGHGRCLVGRPDAETLADKIIKEGWSVRQVEKYIRGETIKNGIRSFQGYVIDEDCLALQSKISKGCGAEARLTMGSNKYKLTLMFDSAEDLDKVIEKICS